MLESKIARLAASAAFTAAVFALAPVAHAETQAYRVGANATRTINLSLCSPTVEISAIGDGDTDVDFDIYNPSGRLIHRDYDETDMTFYTAHRSAQGCSPYQLVMRNLGYVYNSVRVSVEDQ